jgi:predicted site-specific integrase-resolvase
LQGQRIGYVRVSSFDQNPDRQLEQIDVGKVFTDKASGKNTQFLVITHRRGTMEAADVLYGVTMQEDGVSKLLKLDLEQVDATLVS